jgi:hypothetical protein
MAGSNPHETLLANSFESGLSSLAVRQSNSPLRLRTNMSILPSAREIAAKLERLEAEWDRLDALGGREIEQEEITQQMVTLREQLSLVEGRE